jgi:hypothetical protein
VGFQSVGVRGVGLLIFQSESLQVHGKVFHGVSLHIVGLHGVGVNSVESAGC